MQQKGCVFRSRELESSMDADAVQPLSLATRRGRLILLLLCGAVFLDVVDATIVNTALPSIGGHLGFSVQNLQWVVSGYLLTYGGCLLLGGRAADLLGRRRILVAGTSLFGLASLLGGVATSPGMLVAARLAQGIGAAMMTPAAMSLVTTSFTEGGDRVKAIGIWSATPPIAASLGVFLGGVLSQGPGWRWVFIVNVPACAGVCIGALRLLDDDRRSAAVRSFDLVGAVLSTGGMLLLVYGLIEAPDVGWGSSRTIVVLALAVVVLAAFAVNERRQQNPLFPFSILRIKGLAAADATQVLAIAGMYGQFFFLTLYLQDVLHYSPIQCGIANLPAPAGTFLAAGMSAKLLPRIGARPIVIAGTLLGAVGTYLLSTVPVDGSYVADVLPGVLITGVGIGSVLVGVQTAANAGVPPQLAGLAAALVNSSFQLGGALGLAVFSALATAHTRHLELANVAPRAALAGGFARAFLACTVFLVGAAIVAVFINNTRGEAAPEADADTGRVPVLAEEAV
jgi:EmrB/QacA subfamily drug resistance transporter